MEKGYDAFMHRPVPPRVKPRRSSLAGRAVLGVLLLTIASCGSSSNSDGSGSNGSTPNGNIDPGPGGTASTPSCSATLAGAITATAPCAAVVGYYRGELSLGILQPDDDGPVRFLAGMTLSTSDTLAAGRYDFSNLLQFAANVSTEGEDDAGATEPTTWVAAFDGTERIGSVLLTISAVGTKDSQGVYGGTRGVIDAELPSVPPGGPTVTLHAEFVSTANGGGSGSNGVKDGGSRPRP